MDKMTEEKQKPNEKKPISFYLSIAITMTLAIFFMTVLMYVYPFHINDDSCEDDFTITGYFYGMVDNDHLNIDHQSYYVSEWYTTGNYNVPSDIDSFVNHTITIKGFSGCGRSIITRIEKMD